MPVIRDEKKYYTPSEMKKNLNNYIEQTTDELIVELRKRRLEGRGVNKEVCTM